MNIWKKMLAVVAVATLAVVGVPSVAFATTSGDSGGNSGGGGGGGWHWRSAYYSTPGAAWDKFVSVAKKGNLTYNGGYTFEQQIARTGADVNTCKESTTIWWLQDGGTGRWAGDYHGGGTKYFQGSSIPNPRTVHGAAVPKSIVDAFMDYDAQKKGGKWLNDKQPGYVIVCSGDFVQPTKAWKEIEKRNTSAKSSESFKGAYSYQTTVDPQQIVDFNYTGKATKADGSPVDRIGKDNLHRQQSGQVLTEFGKVVDKYNGKSVSTATLKKEVNAALAKDKAATKKHGLVTLDSANQEGLAEGGILNLSEYERTATVTSTTSTTNNQERTCTYTQKWDAAKGAYGTATKKCGSWATVKSSNAYSTASNIPAVQKNTGFWQVLSVHCNKEDFDLLLDALGTKVERVNITGDEDGIISAVIYTKNAGAKPTEVDLGQQADVDLMLTVNDTLEAQVKKTLNMTKQQVMEDVTTSWAKSNLSSADFKSYMSARAGVLSFYDKECTFECTSSGSVADTAGSNADFVRENPPKVNGGGGASITDDSTTYNSSHFKVFRDNEPREIHVAVSYPVSKGVVSYTPDDTKVKSTTITRWSEGTPGVTDANGGKFTMKTVSGKTLFTSVDKAVKQQKNWSTDTFSTSTSTQLEGMHNKFTVQSTWASEDGKPQKLNFKWEYAPTVSTTAPMTNIGFGTSGKPVVGTNKTVSTPIEGKCYATFNGTIDQDAYRGEVQKYTGSGTENKLDEGLRGGSTTELIVEFVRATTE